MLKQATSDKSLHSRSLRLAAFHQGNRQGDVMCSAACFCICLYNDQSEGDHIQRPAATNVPSVFHSLSAGRTGLRLHTYIGPSVSVADLYRRTILAKNNSRSVSPVWEWDIRPTVWPHYHVVNKFSATIWRSLHPQAMFRPQDWRSSDEITEMIGEQSNYGPLFTSLFMELPKETISAHC